MDEVKTASWNLTYDREADVLYATTVHDVISPEPQVGVEIGETGILDVGMFSGIPWGFRILFISQLNESDRIAIIRAIYATARERLAEIECRFSGSPQETIDRVLQLV